MKDGCILQRRSKSSFINSQDSVLLMFNPEFLHKYFRDRIELKDSIKRNSLTSVLLSIGCR